MNASSPITISTFVNLPIEIVWKVWIRPVHIKKWNNASPDWYTPFAKNDLKVGGKFLYRMEARDGSFGFDFEGKYLEVETEKLISYQLEDGRKVWVKFEKEDDGVQITETFEPEQENSVELQREGWQAILDNFKRYSEAL
ncbi:SRPBCC family protein [Algoriphagus marinus]|uniref:SRPBCC family protein n=1 Tax=Algoriphagus marinus TaxID=1925762 RepID=UPI00094B8A34|nr:SRPBCC family protein [Algoriphagus marinus]